MRARLATSADAGSIARIYNQGIEERSATFETALRSEEDVFAWLDGTHPVVVVVDPDSGSVIAFARSSEYSPRECYRGVFELAVYTEASHRRRGAGAAAMRELAIRSRSAGAWKLVARVFVENEASRALLAGLGFREVGTYHRHGKLDGRWRDVVIVEKFLAPVGAEAAIGPDRGRAPRDEILLALRAPSLEVRKRALDHALSLVETVGQPDADLLGAAVDAFFVEKAHDPASRRQFVELFRAYSATSPDAARELYRAVFTRLEGWSIANDLDAFYEALYVVKQLARGSSDGTPVPVRAGESGARAPDLAAYVPLLAEWMKQAIGLPPAMRTRISPGNVTSLLMTLALAGCGSDREKEEVAELAAHAKEKHHVEPPVSLRPVGRPTTMPPPPRPPPLPVAIPRPPPLPKVAAEAPPESILDLDEVLLPESSVSLESGFSEPAADVGAAPTSRRMLDKPDAAEKVELAPRTLEIVPVASTKAPAKAPKKKRQSTGRGKNKRGKHGKDGKADGEGTKEAEPAKSRRGVGKE